MLVVLLQPEILAEGFTLAITVYKFFQKVRGEM